VWPPGAQGGSESIRHGEGRGKSSSHLTGSWRLNALRAGSSLESRYQPLRTERDNQDRDREAGPLPRML
jgi:hypothetical protein